MAALNQELLFRSPNVYSWGGGYDLAPDGRSIAYMWNGSGHWELYLVPIEGGTPRPLTSGADSKMFPRFSPDGARLAFAQDDHGDECFDIHVLDLATGTIANLMPDTPDEGLDEFLRWSPDGCWIYYASNREKDFAIYAVSTVDGTARRMTHHAASDIFAEPSPDGRWLAVQAMVEGQNHAIFLVPTDGAGSEIRLGAEHGLLDAEAPDWSPDSRRIAFMSADQGLVDIAIYDLVTRSIDWLTHGECECYTPLWSPQADRMLYLACRDASLDLVLHNLKGAPETIHIEPGVHNQARFTPDGSALVFTYGGPAYPPDMWMLRLADRKLMQITNSLSSEIDRSVFVQPKHVWYPSLDEGVNVPALLYLPKKDDGRKPPAVVYVHGGPTSQQDNDWYPPIQDFVTRGYVVICPNYRGSTGYGKAFREANRFDLGRGDTNDCAAAADYLIREGLADPARIAVTGISYGGFMTMTCVTQHPDKWAAGSALVPFVNWFTEHATEREDLQYWDEQNMGDPVKDHDRWHENSPIFFIDRITAPIQLIAGGNDVRCPLTEAEQVRDKLLELGRPVEMHVYADEGHILRQLDHRVDAYQKRAAFLDRYLTAL